MTIHDHRQPCTRARRCRVVAAAAALLLAACGGEAPPADGAAEPAVPAPPTAAAEPAQTPPPDAAELARLAPEGERLFTDRGCVGCHAIGGDLAAAPDLEDVTERRSYDWIIGMIVRPDSMTASDPVARELLARHMTQMPNLSLSAEEARAIYAYLRTSGSQ